MAHELQPTDRAAALLAGAAPPATGDRTRAIAAVLAPAVGVAVVLVLTEPAMPAAALLVTAAAGSSCWAVVRLVLAPLVATVAAARAERLRAEIELVAERAERDLRIRLERALRNADSEPTALRTGLRAVAETVPDAEVSLLLNVPEEPRIGWRVDLDAGELDAATPVPGTPGCAALTEGASVVATATSLDACAHLRDLEAEVSAACIPLRAGEVLMGSVCVITAPGEPLDRRTLDGVEWIVERTGQRAAEHRISRGPDTVGRPDPLTGLPGAATLRPHLRDMVRSLSPFCLSVVEIDRFDEIETDADADAALVRVAEALCDTLRPDDMICRTDGSGFAAVLRQCSADEAVAVMERVREGLALLLTQDPDLHLTCSAGVVESHRAASLEEVIDLAVAACEQARAAGGNRVAVSDRTASQP